MAAALGKTPPAPAPTCLFPNLVWRARNAPNQIGKKTGNDFMSLTPGGARPLACSGRFSYRPTGTSVGLAPLAVGRTLFLQRPVVY